MAFPFIFCSVLCAGCQRVLNIILGCLMLIVYPVSFILYFDTMKKDLFNNIMLCVYSIVFSVMLIVFEARLSQMDARIAK